jgi:hypothetical protein
MASLLWGLVVLLVVLWALGFFVAHLGSLIHFLLVLAVIALIWNLITANRSRAL